MKSESQLTFERISELSPPDKLRLAAELLEAQRPELALFVSHMVVRELGAVLAGRKLVHK